MSVVPVVSDIHAVQETKVLIPKVNAVQSKQNSEWSTYMEVCIQKLFKKNLSFS